ncbi:hypothetical protein ACGC1H_006729 [Rhizoctonia solani]|uniref:Cation-transporting P-type ATPase N-terminal domain-containing protein n=1 Tax=Rhizoctonia solani TaxID=456999 RepID=A0A8H3GRH6_9AGAM|nr:unnamed protein product [Rhizoctonia solani]
MPATISCTHSPICLPALDFPPLLSRTRPYAIQSRTYTRAPPPAHACRYSLSPSPRLASLCTRPLAEFFATRSTLLVGSSLVYTHVRTDFSDAKVNMAQIELKAEELYDKDKVDLGTVVFDDVLTLLQCTEEGLTETEAHRRLDRFSPNKLESKE